MATNTRAMRRPPAGRCRLAACSAIVAIMAAGAPSFGGRSSLAFQLTGAGVARLDAGRGCSSPRPRQPVAGSRRSLASKRWLAARSATGSSDPESVGRVVILGAGLHGAALAYYLTQRGVKPLVVERKEVAAAASGKGGGFLARDWGDAITRQLHKVSFELHKELAETLGIESYRRIPVLSVSPGARTARTRDLCPWLDGEIADSSMMDPDGGAQVAPYELCTKLMDAAIAGGAELRIGAAEGVVTEPETEGLERVTGVVVDGETMPADRVCVCLGPWAALMQDWFNIQVPMTGIKSTSIVFKSEEPVEPFALFCGEDDRFGTHLEVYPRSSGEVYMCGIGGSEYVDARMLRAGKYPPGEVFADPKRVEAAAKSFSTMSKRLGGEPDQVQACMRPCLPDARPRDFLSQSLTSFLVSAHAYQVSAVISHESCSTRATHLAGP